jgi:hypothetical protein
MTTLAPKTPSYGRVLETISDWGGRRSSPDVLLGSSLGGALSLFAFVTAGGVDVGPNTWAEIVLTVIGAGLGVAAMLGSAPGRAWGAGTLCLFAALTALTIASISWSVQPDNSWIESNRSVSYLAAFGGAVALARLAPERWPALLGALATLATVVCGYSLLAKVFPATLDQLDPLGRVNLPFDYWNAVGLLAAMALPACLWAGARRERARVLRALSVPAVSILLTTIVLSYSRSAVIAVVVAVGFWFAVVPLRLRAALVLALGALGAAGAVAWALATHPLTHDNQVLAARTIAGHGFGLVLVLMLALTALAGAAAAFALDRHSLGASSRRRVATALLVAVAAIPVAGVAALAVSSRGLTGQISHIWHEFTSPNSGGTGDQAGRLLVIDNSRGTYWNEGLHVGEHALLKGVGAGGFGTARGHYSADPHLNQHAHSYLVQAFADLGLLGLSVSLGLLLAWAAAALRAVGFARPRGWRGGRGVGGRRDGSGGRGGGGRPEPERGEPERAEPERTEHPAASLTPAQATERVGLLTLVAAVIAFGVQSTVDWTWFIPGVAVPALICAGWLAGRGPLDRPVGRRPSRVKRLRTPALGAAATALVAVLVLGAWAMLGPLRAQSADAAAITALSNRNASAAISDARTAANSDPLSVDPYRILAQIYVTLKDPGLARAELVHATTVQPHNADPWRWLGEYDLQSKHRRRAIPELALALSLDLGSVELRNEITQARNDVARALTEKYAPRAPASGSGSGSGSASGSGSNTP